MQLPPPGCCEEKSTSVVCRERMDLSAFPQLTRGDRKASVTHKHYQTLCTSSSLLFVILHFMVFLLLSVFVCFSRCHRSVGMLCVWFPHRSSVVCPAAVLTRTKKAGSGKPQGLHLVPHPDEGIMGQGEGAGEMFPWCGSAVAVPQAGQDLANRGSELPS